MKRMWMSMLLAAFMGVAVAGVSTTPAVARGWHHGGHTHFFLGFNFGWPAYYYYYPPPVYYYPPPPPRVVYVQPRPAPVCRWFRGDATDDASGRPFHGRACLESDGRWHIVN